MTDMAPGLGGTVSCLNCGAQVTVPQLGGGEVTCPKCGAPVAAGERDRVAGDVQLDEVLRGFGANGYDAELVRRGDGVECPVCQVASAADAFRPDDVRGAVDMVRGGTEVVVAALACPSCGALGRIVLDADVDADRALAEAWSGGSG